MKSLSPNDPALIQDITYSWVEEVLIPACEDWQSIGDEVTNEIMQGGGDGSDPVTYTFTQEMFNEEHPSFADRGNDACNFNVTGFASGGSITFKNYFALVATYTERINLHIDYLEGVIRSIVEEVQQAREEIKEALK